jgi:catabolite regulation protein CreA
LVLRDTVEVKGIPDPKIDGVTVYMSNVKDGRWKLKYLLSDPTSASISVNQTGS